jgi:phosphatidylserine decarboxylase
VLPQYLLPKGALTNFAGRVANARGGSRTTALIRWFVGRYNVNMDGARSRHPQLPQLQRILYARPAPDARPLADADFICPVDGRISQFGAIDDDQIFQAKGHNFSTTALVGGELAAQFRNGSFANLYLSPRDYHRIHMPCDGR